MDFVLPFTFSNHGAYRADSSSKDSFHNSLAHADCSDATATSITTWGLNQDISDASVFKGDAPAYGAAIGCADGSIYLFHPAPVEKSSKRASVRLEGSSLAMSDLVSGRISSSSSQHHPRSSSPSSNLLPLSLSRPRVTSGVSKELAEAPKNYVDYDDEPEKLKGMLKDRVVKDRSVPSMLKGNFERRLSLEKTQLGPLSPITPDATSPRHENGRFSFTSRSSPSFTPNSVSPPSSPSLAAFNPNFPVASLQLKGHVLNSRCGFDHTVACMETIADGRYIISMQESGCISIFRTIDGACVLSKTPMKNNRSTVQNKFVPWHWKKLHVLPRFEDFLIVTCATPYNGDSRDTGSESRSRLCVFELRELDQAEFGVASLEQLCDYIVEGPTAGLNLRLDDSDSLILLCPTTTSVYVHRLSFQKSIMLSSMPPPSSSDLLTVGTISLPNPFKAIRERKRPVDTASHPHQNIRTELDAPRDAGLHGLLGAVNGMSVFQDEAKLLLALWSSEELRASATAFFYILSYANDVVQMLGHLQMEEIVQVSWVDNESLIVISETQAQKYTLHRVNAENDSIGEKSTSSSTLIRLRPAQHCALTPYEAFSVANSSQIVGSRKSSKGYRQLQLCTLDVAAKLKPRNLWTATALPRKSALTYITSILPIDLASYLLGYSNGTLRRMSLREMLSSCLSGSSRVASESALDFAVLSLHIVSLATTGEKLVFGGGDDGSVSCWDFSTLTLRSRWIIFTCPLVELIHLQDEHIGQLQGCILCISEDGTIGVIAVETLELLFSIPGAPGALEKICIGEDNLLLIYSDGRARLWDLKTREFWRSTAADKVEGILDQGGWLEIDIAEPDFHVPHTGASKLRTAPNMLGSATSVLVDIGGLVANISKNITERSSTPDKRIIELMQCLLSVVLVPGLDDSLVNVIHDKLGIPISDAFLGMRSSRNTTSWMLHNKPTEAWQMHADATAIRLVTIVTLLRVFLNFEGYESAASAVIVFYTTSLAEAVGPHFKAPNLKYLAQAWLDSPVSEVRHAACSLFEAEVTRRSDHDIEALVDRWKHRLPWVIPETDRQGPETALALFIVANIAIQRYNLLSSSTLTDAAKSISLYLLDESSPHRATAIDLCSRGFHIWQQYFDAMEVLRTLFALATDFRKESISIRNAAAQARLAVLHIASGNTPLFMTTLSLDILHPRTVEYSKSVMQLVAFLIRKKPLVLYPNVPRLVEAVVKSLDPNSGSVRETVMDAAVEILGQIVRTFPSVDFHMGTQRLATGTSEGAVIMYDLKTATRLYVLEGHHRRLTAVSFSPDGRRLVTVSLEESVVLVWKVGGGFTSLFYPGLPPKQGAGGRSGEQPWKTLPFNVGDEANMTIAATLEWVKFEWSSDRSVKLKIRDSILTFST